MRPTSKDWETLDVYYHHLNLVDAHHITRESEMEGEPALTWLGSASAMYGI